MSGCVALTGARALSAFINYSFGYNFGTNEANARIFGAAALLPLRSAMHWEAGHKGRAALGLACSPSWSPMPSEPDRLRHANKNQLAGSQETLPGCWIRSLIGIRRGSPQGVKRGSVSRGDRGENRGREEGPAPGIDRGLHERDGNSWREMEADFQRWCRSRGAPGCDVKRLARLIGAACLELGLAEDESVVGGLIRKP
jgi:hypothetical protein